MSLCIYVVKRKSKWFILLLHLLRNSLSVSLSELNQTEMLVQWSILYTPYVVERCCTKYLIKIMYPHYKILGLGFFYSFEPKNPHSTFSQPMKLSLKKLMGSPNYGGFFCQLFLVSFSLSFSISVERKKGGRLFTATD